ncbi:MAG: polysaccharide deacetylase family protein [Acidobacteriaceae bacterium]|nr:polysaccharide deacetylase family protein [Acidobacteriaceae bacterium]MBV9767181.1 polysaccharide deacetylase family protein [Acidobacteriaceae bacterium]
MRGLGVAGIATGALVGGLSATAAYGSVSKSSQLFGPSVYRGPGRRRSIALTFDDGPSEGTLSLLDYLSKEDIKATFFQCGMNVQRLPHIAGKVAAAGHQLGNHTYSHPKLPFKSPEFIDREFTEAQEIINSETGVAPMLLRAPYGFRWIGMRNVQRKLALLGVMWTVIGHDWRWPANRIVQHVLDHSSPGGIICLHDGRAVEKSPNIQHTLSAVRQIVPVLRDAGYSFETVSELMHV